MIRKKPAKRVLSERELELIVENWDWEKSEDETLSASEDEDEDEDEDEGDMRTQINVFYIVSMCVYQLINNYDFFS